MSQAITDNALNRSNAFFVAQDEDKEPKISKVDGGAVIIFTHWIT